MQYKKQVKQIKSILSEVDGLEDNLADLGCFITGGAVTSIFTKKEVNDLDIYFRDQESLEVFIKTAFDEYDKQSKNLTQIEKMFADVENLSGFSLRYVGHTKKSIVFTTQSGQIVQLIIDRFYESPQDIYNTFDFHLNMGCFDCREDKFVLSESFLLDNCSKSITVNPRTSYPIMSQIRLAKYQERGYHINRKEFMLLSCAVASLTLENWGDVKSQLGGLYGYNIDELFDEEKEFSFEELFTQLEELEHKENTFVPMDFFCDGETALIEHVRKLHS